MTTARERELEGAVRRLERLFQDQQREIRALKTARRAPQLGHSSIESGALEVRDPETGATRLRFGYQPDGRAAVVTEGGEPVTAPTAPTVTPMPSGLRVSWDGALADDSALPSDFDHVNVHVSEMDGFTPSEATFVVTIPRSAGAVPIAPLTVGATYYVRLVPVTTGGIVGDPSAQASGVPAAVTDIAPGSITETEIADDAISTPKLRAEAVTALKIAAEAIEAGHIKAAAVTASKLEAELVLGTRIIAGTPSGARVELDSNGIRGYNAADELVFVVDDTGTALFSGDIVASEITGSRMVVGTAPGPTGTIEGDASTVVQRVQVGTITAQLAASSSSGFTATTDITNPSAPLAGFSALSGQVNFVLDSSATVADAKPSVTGVAFPTSAQLALWSQRNNTSAPRAGLAATATEALGIWSSDTGASVQITAQAGWAGISALPEASTVGQPSASPGMIYGFRRASTDAPTLSLQSPMSSSGAGASRRSIIHVEGANTNRPYTVLNHAARVHFLQGELVSGSTDTTTNGVVELASTHSILAPRHAPIRTDMVTAPSGSFGTGTGGGVWTAFTNAAWPHRTFRTGWSGRVRFTITAAAGNTNTANATIHFGFALSGGSTVPPAVSRAWNARSTTMQCCSRVVYLDLIANADYTLVPHFNISSGTVGTTVLIQDTYEHSIVIEPLV